jgi:hypothetical protein
MISFWFMQTGLIASGFRMAWEWEACCLLRIRRGVSAASSLERSSLMEKGKGSLALGVVSCQTHQNL